MPKSLTKSAGIRMPTELYSWIDNRAARRKTTRSQYVCELVKVARKALSPKPAVKPPWTVNAAKVGEYFSVGIIIVGFQCIFSVL